jgi:hypothetical protein
MKDTCRDDWGRTFVDPASKMEHTSGITPRKIFAVTALRTSNQTLRTTHSLEAGSGRMR